mmetsp:Transcript_2826/g.2351  ORF Transcript_2826/g.2351 Transcript_2826/m.2351 type:complete len:124 (-) Transcript_2826:32-403(-)
MLLMTIFAKEPVILIIALCLNIKAYGITIIHAVYSTKIESVVTRIGNGVVEEGKSDKTAHRNHQPMDLPRVNVPTIINDITGDKFSKNQYNSEGPINNEVKLDDVSSENNKDWGDFEESKEGS